MGNCFKCFHCFTFSMTFSLFILSVTFSNFFFWLFVATLFPLLLNYFGYSTRGK